MMVNGPQGGWQSADDLFTKYRSSFLWVIAIGTLLFMVCILAIFWNSLTTTTIVMIMVTSIVFFLIMYAITRRLLRRMVPTSWLKVNMPADGVVALIEGALDQEGVPNIRYTFKDYASAGMNPTVRMGLRDLPNDFNGYAFDLWDGVRVITTSPEPPRGPRTDIVVYPLRGEHEKVLDRVKARIEIPFMQKHQDL
jgi:hypothetical protein